jgi:hypothetical protein
VGASNGAHILGTLVLGEEPSTASIAEVDCGQGWRTGPTRKNSIDPRYWKRDDTTVLRT